MASQKTTSKTQARGSKSEKAEGKPAPPQVIDTTLKNDRSVELRGSAPLAAATVAQVQRALLLQHMAKNGSSSSLKLYLGAADANKYRLQDQAALADTMSLVGTPVDVIIRAGIGPDVLKTYLSATGKRFMYAGATLHMGPVTSNAPYGKNKASQVRRQLFNDYNTDLQTLVMMKSGEKDRAKVYRDLLSARGLSALEALAYGRHGLIDGILIGADQVVTRKELEAFYKRENLKKEDLAEFNRHYINVYQVPTRALKSYSAASLPAGTDCFYTSLKKPVAEPVKKDDKAAEAKAKAKPEGPKLPIFYFDEKKIDPLPMMTRASKDKASKRMMVENLPATANGILDDDVIFFNDGFRDETAEQITDALVALDHKKVKTGSKSHIKILENSPGGSVWSGQELRSLIRSLHTPVDVIVYGMGASCGSWLLCSASGNRYATSQARIMFHEAANELRNQTPHDHYNEMHDGLDQATLDYIAIVAEATDRPFEEVLRDFDNDVWLNPLESLFYGNKGLIDAVLVGHNRMVTRADAEKVLAKTMGGKAKFARYVDAKIQEKRDPRQSMEWRPEKHNETDPFDNPLVTLAHLAAEVSRPLSDVARFKGSLPVPAADRTIDYFNVVFDDDKK